MKLALFRQFIAVLTLTVMLFCACSKPTPFGAGVLEDELAQYTFTDTFGIELKTVLEDSVLTSDRSSTLDYFLCGELNDPVFGKTQSEIFTLFRLGTFIPNFKNSDNVTPVHLDSIILYLRYDPNGILGDTTQAQNIEVFRVDQGQQVVYGRNYKADESLAATEQIGSLALNSVRPRTNIPLIFGSGSTKDSIGKAPYIRIPLSASFGAELMGLDTTEYQFDTLFWKKLRGIAIKTNSPNSKAMLAFDLNNTTFSRVTLHYTKDDTLKLRYHFDFAGGNKFMHFTHDYSGTMVESHLNVPNDSLIFLQSMYGLRANINIPGLKNLSDVVINKAELEFTVASIASDNTTNFPPAQQLILTDALGALIEDVSFSLGGQLVGGFGNFGGQPEIFTHNGLTYQRYKMILSQRLQNMIGQGGTGNVGTSLFMSAYPQQLSPMRVILHGQKNSPFPAKLTVKYTKI